ncbi:hypothetical protein HDK90DRAFT_69684 [Phyllosticta capitalensis]|uniref:Uncharacterized protein n=1 Tax=Phyllosticta capitalensis TaxID=121624 RepID=A0ABR1YCJ4_9PEZI
MAAVPSTKTTPYAGTESKKSYSGQRRSGWPCSAHDQASPLAAATRPWFLEQLWYLVYLLVTAPLFMDCRKSHFENVTTGIHWKQRAPWPAYKTQENGTFGRRVKAASEEENDQQLTLVLARPHLQPCYRCKSTIRSAFPSVGCIRLLGGGRHWVDSRMPISPPTPDLVCLHVPMAKLHVASAPHCRQNLSVPMPLSSPSGNPAI